MNPKLQGLDLSNDILFSVLMQRERFCQAVLLILLNREVMSIEYHQVEKSFQNLPGYRSVRLDVYARDESLISLARGDINTRSKTAVRRQISRWETKV